MHITNHERCTIDMRDIFPQITHLLLRIIGEHSFDRLSVPSISRTSGDYTVFEDSKPSGLLPHASSSTPFVLF